MTEPDIASLSGRQIYANRWMRLREDSIRRADGSLGVYAVVEKPDFAVVIPIADNGDCYLVEQYRYPVGGRFWEFPRGAREDRPDTPLASVAAHEVREEVGLIGGSFEPLGRLYEAYGYCDQAFEVFVFRDFEARSPDRSREEADMISRSFPRATVETMLKEGKIADGASAAAYGLLLLHERNGAAQT